MLEDTPIAELSFEEALKKLREIVDRLDKGDIPLEEAVDAYERGKQLQDHCQNKLKVAEERLQKVVGDGQGTEPIGDV